MLLSTLDTWLNCGGSAARAAERLFCHRNTVLNRLRKIEQLTRRRLARPSDLVELVLALSAVRLHGSGADAQGAVPSTAPAPVLGSGPGLGPAAHKAGPPARGGRPLR
ncbi:PucR family transcriptional regulator [Actinomadura sp. CNU-125]|uniref:PucR family transcriptional regulator n=1 Tax=Actinomadura sp. CNU-125 TaxID=1904961 RepID=UPI0021CCD6AD|nr:helix-turn-helix domain-containing protein [Actinomadura sp. CNU-125]